MHIKNAATSFREKEAILDPESAASNGDHSAAIPLSALNNLNRAVAMIGPNNNILYRNDFFSNLFGAGELPAALRECVSSVAQGTGLAASREVSFDGGQTLRIETINLPQGLLIVVEDISARVAEQMLFAEQARTDPLTLLGNRLMFREHLRDLITNFVPAKDVAAVLSLDLDRFKAINDTLGHPVGDSLLRGVAGRLRSVIRRGDIVARLGGDEFGIIQIGQSQPQSAAALAKRLVDVLGRSYLIDGNLLNIGASVGIALIPADGIDDDQILKNADLALYQAKRERRGSWRFFEAAMNDKMQARRSFEIDLRRALAMRELKLVYQPQSNLRTKQIIGFEALIRWHSVKRGLISPGDFIPLAEEIGVIVQIGEWVIRTACREAARWRQPLAISVNVSAVQFGSSSLVPTILSALAESGIDPRRLELEVTESVLMSDKSAALDVLRKVRAVGVRVSMDDFGTGYSSLSYLRSFPFDKIKIDQSFIRGNNSDDPNSAAIVRAIAALGKALGMTTTAEGVETEEQLARVTADGCTEVQGYLISKPLPPESIDGFLQSHEADPVAPAAI